MKTVCYIIATVIAGLAVYPCNDANISVDDQKYSQSVVDESGVDVYDHNHSPSETDLCTPFCVCSCCSSHANQPSFFCFEAFIPNYTDLTSKLKDQSVKPIYFAIWQPPKLS